MNPLSSLLCWSMSACVEAPSENLPPPLVLHAEDLEPGAVVMVEGIVTTAFLVNVQQGWTPVHLVLDDGTRVAIHNEEQRNAIAAFYGRRVRFTASVFARLAPSGALDPDLDAAAIVDLAGAVDVMPPSPDQFMRTRSGLRPPVDGVVSCTGWEGPIGPKGIPALALAATPDGLHLATADQQTSVPWRDARVYGVSFVDAIGEDNLAEVVVLAHTADGDRTAAFGWPGGRLARLDSLDEVLSDVTSTDQLTAALWRVPYASFAVTEAEAAPGVSCSAR